jgi:hypothetical protein
LADLVERDLGGFVAVFCCRCKNKNRFWAEFWWKPDKDEHEWAFFDDQGRERGPRGACDQVLGMRRAAASQDADTGVDGGFLPLYPGRANP